jgi:hypothetical protein
VESVRIKELEQENRELKRANEILKRTASFFGAELDANTRNSRLYRGPPRRVRGRAHLRRAAKRRGVYGPEHLLRRQNPADVSAPAVTRCWVQRWWRCRRTTIACTGLISCGKQLVGPATTWAATRLEQNQCVSDSRVVAVSLLPSRRRLQVPRTRTREHRDHAPFAPGLQ